MKTLRTGLAVVLVSFVSVMGLVVVEATPASAFGVPSPIGVLSKGAGVAAGLIEEAAAGGGAEGVTLVGEASNPAGWVIGAGTLAYLGYKNKDAIMQFLSGDKTPKTLADWAACDAYVQQHGGSCADAPPAAAPPNLWQDGNTSVELIQHSAEGLTIKVTALNCPNGCGSFAAHWTLASPVAPANTQGESCRNNTTGAIVLRSITGSVDLGHTNSGGQLSQNLSFSCLATETAVGLHINAQTNNQTYVVDWGLPPDYPPGQVKFAGANITVRCQNASTGAQQDLIGYSDTLDGTVVIPSCRARLGEGWHTAGVTIAPANPQIDNQPITTPVPDFLPLKWDELVPAEGTPDWQPCQKDPFGCNMGLWIDNEPCDAARTVCHNWEELNKESPDRIKCRYGDKFVATKYCFPLGAWYNQPGQQTSSGTQPGQTTSPGTGTGDATGTSGQTTTTPKPPADPAEAPSQTKCFPKGWGVFNPFEWIYKPMICALKDAFIPSQSWSTWTAGLGSAFSGKAPFSWIASLSGLPSSISSGGCPTDWVFHFQGRSYPILCGTAAGDKIHSYRPLITVLALGAAVYPLLRSLVYSVIPIVRPEPSSGGDV